MINSGKERDEIKREMKNVLALGMKRILDAVLFTEANTTSCMMIYQPKAPKELKKYRRNKQWKSARKW